ncbi:MAG: CYTH domain-containing protein, partial [Candidatus Krumholzibacteriia bacterium]
MGIEIERKYLVTGDAWRALGPGVPYRQGYLCTDRERVVRVRTMGQRAALTVKGLPVGATRPEFEYPIPVDDARRLLELCLQPIIEKTRYTVQAAGRTWEVDEFHGANAGLVVAECELEAADQPLRLPAWVGE